VKSKEGQYFDNIADVFDTHFNAYSKAAGALRVKRRIELFFRHCRFKPGAKILEIGTGTGEYAKGLSVYGSSLFCTDISFNMLNKAITKVTKQGSARFFVSDIGQLPSRDETFDAVVGNAVLHHLDIKKALPELFRVLKKGGVFAFTEPNMLNPQIFLQKHIRFLRKLAGDTDTETAFLRWQIRKIFESSGFKAVQVEPFDFLHPHTPGFISGVVNSAGLALEKLFLCREIAGSLLIRGKK